MIKEDSVSVIITTFNRENVISEAISSAINFSTRISSDSDVILIDDHSSDNTLQSVTSLFKKQIDAGRLKIRSFPVNSGGPAKPRNDGAKLSNCKWAIWLDSDDQLIAESASQIINYINNNKTVDIFFLRCIDQNGCLIGKKIQYMKAISLSDICENGLPSECPALMKTNLLRLYQLDEDLNCHEALLYKRVIRDGYNAVVLPVYARIYNNDINVPCLSSDIHNGRIGNKIAKSYLRSLREFHRYQSARVNSIQLIKVFVHIFRWFVFRMISFYRG